MLIKYFRHTSFLTIILFINLNYAHAQLIPRQWTQYSLNDYARKVLVAPSSNIYVTGWDPSSSPNYNIFVYKCDSAGNLLWHRNYFGLMGLADNAFGLCVDDSEDVYISGNTDHSLAGSKSIILKYDSSGNLQWDRNTLNSIEAIDVVSDGTNAIYLLELLIDSLSYNYAALTKYDYSGNLIWTNIDTTFTQGIQLGRDNAMNIYVCGEINPNGGLFVSKYDTSGNLKWKVGSGYWVNFFPELHPMAIDDSANIYIAGMYRIAQNYDKGILIKYDSTGAMLWTRTYDFPGTEQPLSIDSRYSRVNITGRLEHDSPLFPDIDLFIVSFDKMGNLIFQDTLHDQVGMNDMGYDLIIDDSKNSIITGRYGYFNQCYSQILLKYDSNGVSSVLDSITCASGRVIEITSSGDIYVAGVQYDSINNVDNGTLIKYSFNIVSAVNEATRDDTYKIFPNPTSGILEVDIALSNKAEGSIYDSSGRKIECQIKYADNKMFLNLNYLAAGTYILKLNGSTNKTFVVLKY